MKCRFCGQDIRAQKLSNGDTAYVTDDTYPYDCPKPHASFWNGRRYENEYGGHQPWPLDMPK